MNTHGGKFLFDFMVTIPTIDTLEDGSVIAAETHSRFIIDLLSVFHGVMNQGLNVSTDLDSFFLAMVTQPIVLGVIQTD